MDCILVPVGFSCCPVYGGGSPVEDSLLLNFVFGPGFDSSAKRHF